MTTPKPERYAIILQALPDQEGPAAALRLRRALKFCLRVCRLKCLEARELPSHLDSTTTAPPMPPAGSDTTSGSERPLR